VPKPVIPSRLALQDIDRAWNFYLSDAGARVAGDFVDALEAAVALVGREPGIGSPRWAHELNLAGLRSWRITGFPQLLLYFEQEDAVDLVRVLHGASDIPALLRETD